MRNIAVTGGSGFLGKFIRKALTKSGYKIINLDITEGIDITNWDEISQITNFDTLIHLAAISFVPDSYKMPRSFFMKNIAGTINALELCKINNARMIYTSSYVYGNPVYLPIDENHPVSDFNPYSSSKILSEKICESYNKYFGLDIKIVRPFNMYGPGQNVNFLIPSIINQIETRKVILNDSTPRRDFVYVGDVAEAFVKIVDYSNPEYLILNIGYGKSYSIGDIINTLKDLVHTDFEVEFTGIIRPNEIQDTVADISKAHKIINWKPEIPFKEGLKKCLEAVEINK